MSESPSPVTHRSQPGSLSLPGGLPPEPVSLQLLTYCVATEANLDASPVCYLYRLRNDTADSLRRFDEMRVGKVGVARRRLGVVQLSCFREGACCRCAPRIGPSMLPVTVRIMASRSTCAPIAPENNGYRWQISLVLTWC